MRKLIIFRSGHFTGELVRGAGKSTLPRATEKGKQRIRNSAEQLKPFLQEMTFRVFCADIPDVADCARQMAKHLGKAQAIYSPALGKVGGSRTDLALALDLIREHSSDRDALILVAHREVANNLPAYFGQNMPGAFPIYLDRPLYKGEGVIIDLENRSYQLVATPNLS